MINVRLLLRNICAFDKLYNNFYIIFLQRYSIYLTTHINSILQMTVFGVQNKLEFTLSPVGVALGVVISTVIIGFLILLIWKILTMIHDKREYAKFEKERALAKWDRVSRYSPLFPIAWL